MIDMLLSDLEFGSYLTYSPRGETEEILKSRRLRDNLKGDKHVSSPPQTTTRYLVDILAQRITQTPLQGVLGSDVSLVPVPKSSLLLPGSLWVPQRIADALVEVGLGNGVFPILERRRFVPKAAFSAPENRPKAIDHFETIDVHLQLEPMERIVLVDDIITRGATMLGAASRLAEAYPEAEIRAFAMVRTMSRPEAFVQIEDPCLGHIRLSGDQTFREP